MYEETVSGMKENNRVGKVYYDPYEDVEFKEIDRERKHRKKKHYFLRFLFFVCIVVFAAIILSSSIFDITDIQVTGNKYYSDEQIITIANAKKGVNILWGAGSGDIKKRLLSNSYFSDVNIKRKLPGTLVIKVEERSQVASIVYGDEYVIISGEGIVLRKSDVEPKITLITGLTISRLTVGEDVEAEEAQTLKNTLDMLTAMEDGDIFFKRIDVSGVTIKAYIYDTLIVKGTPKQMLKAIKDGNLQKVVNNLFKNDTTRGTIHLGDKNYMSFSPDFD